MAVLIPIKNAQAILGVFLLPVSIGTAQHSSTPDTALFRVSVWGKPDV
ncbi:hypothetical protein M2R47_04195 [Moraxella sp. Tifton1]|nr:hypothetical protein [Moraxella sp. Tifton1]MCL1623449.1 hypothetical protein [Moraxella sp. Tifton1]